MSDFELIINEVDFEMNTGALQSVNDNVQTILRSYNNQHDDDGVVVQGQRMKMFAWDQSLG